MVQKLSKKNQSVEKTMRIVEILAQGNGPMRLSDIAQLAELPASTTLRMVNTLLECGYVYQDEKGSQGYALTMRFLRIGQMVAERFSIRDLVHPYLLELAQQVGESCCLAVPEHSIVRYLDVVENTQNAIRIRQRIGDIVPLHSTASGKLFLTQYSPERLAEFIAEGLPRKTPRTLITADALQYELQETIRRGYAIDDEECEDGMYCVAYPIYDIHESIIATLCVSGPIGRMTRDRVARVILPKLKECTQEIIRTINGKR